METPELTFQNQTDVDEQIAKRIDFIYKVFPGGLGEFFDNLRHEHGDQETSDSPIDRVIDKHLSAVAKVASQSSGANSWPQFQTEYKSFCNGLWGIRRADR